MDENVKDEIIEEIREIKDQLSSEGNGSFEDLASRIIQEASAIEHRGGSIDLRERKQLVEKK